MNNRPVPVAIALGSNLGDRDAQFDYAISRLSRFLSGIRASSRYDTAPVDVVGEQPRYLNGAVAGFTLLSPHELLARLQEIERERGRERPHANAPRTLDLDLVLYGDVVIREGLLTVPHPRFRDRTFVLEPLSEIAPDMIDPVTGLTVSALRDRLRSLHHEEREDHEPR